MTMIHKYEVPLLDTQVLALNGKLEKPLTVQMQHGRMVLWAEVNPGLPDGPMNAIEIRIAATGQPAPHTSYIYLSTVQDPAGFVWHIYWRLA
jgi:hypothetical protein